MPAYLVTITYSGIVFGDDEKEALECAPDVFRASMFGPIHSEVVPLEQEPPEAKSTGEADSTGPAII